ncbi:hypothetical protein FRACYDRAFT_243705 [Fragilariopsis cylindrus CCMP1102]|uniref:Uncharacterized protein n=1 Tax=Fragilariopsis cylindrus CCMP1102 TaxID=635003 RepID=A0A1E7F3M8_9STRA|nr:hypothetical protein FRACYDRAFT_243705 [Fragilariopsis cylindrus CCMP1102]|eukprot:OEU12453.1 hypothetical protein FRACYDRAFT_243705 [Fragilariopsis cylindrus CCMP1102]
MTTESSTSTNKNEANKCGIIYLRYDQVGPQIVETGSSGSIGSSIAPKTHFLSSIPKKYRLLTSDLLGVDVVGSSLHVGSSSDGSSESDGSSGSLESEKKKNHKLLLDDYSSNKNNVWPNKLHLFEMNPSIAKLPDKYRQDPTWQTYFNSSNKGNGMPLYVSVYRITHWNNCYDGDINLNMYGGSWENVLGKSKFSNVSIPQTDYIGLSLLDSKLNILKDITVNLKTVSTVKFFPNYNDHRLFNLNEQLYFTSVNHIAPIELSLTSLVAQDQDQSQGEQQQKQSQSPPISDGYIQIPNAFQNDDAVNNADVNVNADNVKNNVTNVTTALSSTQQLQLQVFIRKYSSCPIGKTINKRAQTSKNLLYFQNNNRNNDIKLLFQPRWNPNEVFHKVNLNLKCNIGKGKDTTLKYSTTFDPQEQQAIEKFETVEKSLYPNYNYDELFVQDRGSACCIDIYVNTINSDIDENKNKHESKQNQNNQKQDKKQLQKLKVAVVHPKTKYPGKQLPLGITPNTYLSRFIAFLPNDPYTILYKSNMFCLPYPTLDDKEGGDNTNDNSNDNDDNNGSNLNPLTYMKMVPLEFGMNETAAYYNCPRIHFVTGMIDKIDNSKDTDNNGGDEANNDSNNDGSVILSYGVSDCLSRFIEIKKSEIIRMLI